MHPNARLLLYIDVDMEVSVHEPSFSNETAERFLDSVSVSAGRTAYVMLAHYLNRSVEAEFEHLLSDLGSADVYLLYDDTHHPFPDSYDIRQLQNEGASPSFYGRVFIVNDRDLRTISPSFESAWDNIQTLLVAFYRAVILPQHPYDHVWFLESDVRCNGNYKKTFEKSEGLVEDFLALWAVGRTENWGAALHEWNWHRLSGVPMEERYGAFLPVMRLSRSALKILSDNASSDVTGFCEVYIPTVIHVNGGTVGNLPTGMFGEFQYRPQMTQAEYAALPGKAEDVLYHPVI
jgi:hypothetical protein